MFKIYYFTTASGRRPAKEFIEEQSKEAQNKIHEAIDYLREYGFHLEVKYLRRMSGVKGLWELRAKYQSDQFRFFLSKLAGREIVLLHAIIKKTAKTPKRDIQTAEKRMRLMGIR